MIVPPVRPLRLQSVAPGKIWRRTEISVHRAKGLSVVFAEM